MFAAPNFMIQLPADSGAHYSDDFNRSNSSTLGANWTSYNILGLGTEFRILNNTAAASATGVPTYGFDFLLSEYNSDMATDDYSVSVEMATTPYDTQIYLRSNGTDYVYADSPTSGTWTIRTSTGDSSPYLRDGTGTIRASTGDTLSAGDVFLFQAVGDVYTVKKNGSTVLSWTDTGGSAHGSYVDSNHRKAAIYIQASTASASIDNFDAQDI